MNNKTVWITNPKNLGVYKEICYTGPVRIEHSHTSGAYRLYFPITVSILSEFDGNYYERDSVILISSEMDKLQYEEI